MSGFYLKCIKDVILKQESFRELETQSAGLLEASIIMDYGRPLLKGNSCVDDDGCFVKHYLF